MTKLCIEEPILGISPTESPINTFKNQLHVSYSHLPRKTTRRCIWDDNKKNIWHIYIVKDDLSPVISFFKEYGVPKSTYAFIFETQDPEKLSNEISNLMRMTFKNSAFKLLVCNKKLEDVTNKDRQKELLQYNHETKTNHRGIVETIAQIKRKFYWPNIANDVRKFVNSCEICQRTKYDRNPPRIEFQITPSPKKPFEIIHIDVFQADSKKFLTVIDKFSKFGQAFPLKAANATEIVNALIKFMSFYGLPTQIVTDPGTEFNNSTIKDFTNLHKINIHFGTSKNSNSNSPVERFHSTILEHLRVLKIQKPDIEVTDLMPYAIFGYNHSIHSTTKQKPIDIMSGHIDTKDPFDIDANQVLLNNYMQQHKEKTQLMYQRIHESSKKHKENLIEKTNLSREKPTVYPENIEAYRKNVKTRGNKLKPPFIKEKVVRDDNLKLTTNRNTYHKNIFKRPRFKGDSNLLQADPSTPLEEQPGTSNNHASN